MIIFVCPCYVNNVVLHKSFMPKTKWKHFVHDENASDEQRERTRNMCLCKMDFSFLDMQEHRNEFP